MTVPVPYRIGRYAGVAVRIPGYACRLRPHSGRDGSSRHGSPGAADGGRTVGDELLAGLALGCSGRFASVGMRAERKLQGPGVQRPHIARGGVDDADRPLPRG